MDTDVQQMVQVKEDPEEQSAGVDQQDPEHLHIKEEQEELWTSLEGEHLCLKEETEAVGFPVTAVSIKSEDDEEKPLVSQLHQQQIEDRDVPTSSSADQMTAETGGGAGTSRNPDLNPHEQTSDSSETEVSGDDDDDDDDYEIKITMMMELIVITMTVMMMMMRKKLFQDLPFLRATVPNPPAARERRRT
uniref:Uncharacterized protein n=1 Tax=Nothobranchius kadleci TaxID=1051664 RepID=A0A1A8DYX3_NOTKA